MSQADLVLRGAPIWTADPAHPHAEAIALGDGTVRIVGRRSDVEPLIGNGTRVIDLPGDHLVLPGFIDAHTHYANGPLMAAGVDLSECDTLEEIGSVLETAEPSGGVVIGFGWRTHIFPNGPDRHLLDDIFGTTPVVLREIDAHSVWANTAALAEAGISAGTPDPVAGFSVYVRDARGEPTGWVLEEPALQHVWDAIDPPTLQRFRDELAAMQSRYAAAGLTAVFDAGIFTIAERDGWAILADLDRNGLLRQRVTASKVAPFDPEDAVQILVAARDDHATANVTVDTLKVFVDGVPEAHTSAYLEPYDDHPDTSGPLAASEEQIRRWVIDADAAGRSAHLHAIGDRAVRVALDAVEAARARGDSGVIHTICHGDLIDPADLPRFADLGVVWNTSGQWIASSPVDMVMCRRVGDRALRQYRLRAALDLGVTVTLGADFPASSYVSTYKPLVLIESAVTRRLAGDTESDPLPPADEALSVEQALRAMTTSAAYQLGIDDRTGSLAPGKDADLVVLGRNLFEIPPHEIAATPVLATIRAGRSTHDNL